MVGGRLLAMARPPKLPMRHRLGPLLHAVHTVTVCEPSLLCVATEDDVDDLILGPSRSTLGPAINSLPQSSCVLHHHLSARSTPPWEPILTLSDIASVSDHHNHQRAVGEIRHS
ncbi:hypothetical protein ZWY2020_046557 [Hordeum vulgare]|nr:hypothetical protein ZWY2020_046557 [Hordeum vulgare]